MAFSVYTENRRLYADYGDDESFDIVEGGALRITRADGKRHYVNAALWETIDETQPPPAARPSVAPSFDPDPGGFDPMTTQF